jgi:hypothetical protein
LFLLRREPPITFTFVGKGNAIGDNGEGTGDDGVSFGRALTMNTTLQNLDLGGNLLNFGGKEILAALKHNKGITCLDLRSKTSTFCFALI